MNKDEKSFRIGNRRWLLYKEWSFAVFMKLPLYWFRMFPLAKESLTGISYTFSKVSFSPNPVIFFHPFEIQIVLFNLIFLIKYKQKSFVVIPCYRVWNYSSFIFSSWFKLKILLTVTLTATYLNPFYNAKKHRF